MPYLAALGVSHCYASPLLKARPGSPHGYDITNHKELNGEIGSREDFEHFTATLRAHGMGLIVDIVPNHMGAGPDNPWWMDVLENGPSSLYADYFDIDWQPLTDGLENKILLAVLGDAYGKILESGELQLRFDAETGCFSLDYYEARFPINPNSFGLIMGHRLNVLEARLGQDKSPLYEYQSIMTALDNLPELLVESDGGDALAVKEVRMRERTIALNRLSVLCRQSPAVQAFIEENVQDFQLRVEDPTSLNRLHRLLERQHYRLSNWRVASDEINYRRFFDVNDLVALRMEDPRVFNDTHALILDLIAQGHIQGLRIDHPDGLFDPAAYFLQLQQEAARRLGLPESGDWRLGAPDLPLFVLIEKILAPFERLPEEWAVHGTTGYDFTNAVNALFVDGEKEKAFTRLYERILGTRVNFGELVYQCKRLIMETTLNSELAVLSAKLYRIARRHWVFRDYTLQNIRAALIELVACFPVYRTYVVPESLSRQGSISRNPKNRDYIDWAVGLAKRRSTVTDPGIFDFIRQVLLLEDISLPSALSLEPAPKNRPTLSTASDAEPSYPLPEASREAADLARAVERFALKFQQYTGPVMAKGLEDTSFYRYNRLVTLNEVGGEPQQFGLSVNAFHQKNLDRLRRMPQAMLATSTHDTKRSEDVRARLSVLSEMPDEWQKHVMLWRRLNRPFRKTLEFDQIAPSENAEYLFYQTLVGIWPLEAPSTREARTALAERITEYMLKASKEAKTFTSWINPNTDYEAALAGFVRGVLLAPVRGFMEDFLPFVAQVSRLGLYNSLSQTLLKLTVPGVPDLYQGTECWDFSLVDPDNRRPVDYGHRQSQLEALRANLAEPRPEVLADMTAHLADGRLKQLLIAAVLGYRGQHPALFDRGEYIPLEVTGRNAEHVVAFARLSEDEAVIVVVPRLCYTLGLGRYELPCGRRPWRDTAVLLPPELADFSFSNPMTGDVFPSGEPQRLALPMAEVLRLLPVAFLVADSAPALPILPPEA